MGEIEKNFPVKMSKPYGTERKNMRIKSIGDEEANCLQAHYAKGLSDGDTAVMKIKVIGNKNPSGHGQGGAVYDSDGILGALNVAKSTAPNIAVRAVLTPDREEKRQNGRRMKEEGEPMFTLTAQDRHGIAIREATKQGYTLAEVGDSVNLSQPNSATRRGRVGKAIANTLTCNDHMAVVVEKGVEVVGNYSPSGHEASRVVSSDGLAPTVKENHGTVTATIVDDQGRTNKELKPKDICPTLRAQSHGNEPKVIDALYANRQPREYIEATPTLRSERQGLLTASGVRIRKLTPKECWRLQGFPDEYFDKAKAAGVSDSQLYKQAGNAVTVNVARAIGERLKEIEEERE